MTIKTIISAAVIGFGLTLSACSNSDAPEARATANITQTQIKAVLVYADWCGSCKVLDPKLKAVMPAYEGQAVEWITLDYTDRNEESFYASASQYGVEEAVRAAMDDKVKTGQLLLVPHGSDTPVDVIKMTHTEDEIRAKLDSALTAS